MEHFTSEEFVTSAQGAVFSQMLANKVEEYRAEHGVLEYEKALKQLLETDDEARLIAEMAYGTRVE